MRTTLTIDDALYRRVKAQAALAGMSVGAVIEQALRAQLRERAARGDTPLDLPAFDCGAFLPGIDPLDTSALLDTLASPDDRERAGQPS
jgi:hypothetical protein